MTNSRKCDKCFVHPIFRFWSLLVTKLQKYKNITKSLFTSARQDGEDGKKTGKKIKQQIKVTKIPKTKTQKYWMNKTKAVEMVQNVVLKGQLQK